MPGSQNFKILLIDDDPEMGSIVCAILAPLIVQHALSAEDAVLKLASISYDLILLDINLPGKDGISFCLELAKDPALQKIPVMMVSGRSQTNDIVSGLQAGADDYLTKPFSADELRARVDARIRRTRTGTSIILSLGSIVLDLEQQSCWVNEKGTKTVRDLTPTEFRILWILIKQTEQFLTRNEIAAILRSSHGIAIESRGIDSHISRLRKKLCTPDIEIASVYRKGYQLRLV